MNIWEVMYDRFYFTKKKITLFESFSGIGAFHKGLTILSKELGIELEVVGISEIDKYAIMAYNEIHGETRNYGSICDIQEIPQVDIFTYSFPCQDISLAGKQKGFSKGSGTRSGLLWEVERLLENQEKIGKLPQVLIMENVKALVGMKFKDDFIEWQLKLQELGYTSYWEVLNAKNYGIPQNRERVFMVSILGEYYYEFPKPFPLELRLKDMLEDEVDEKYYLSDKQMQQLKETPHEKSSISRGKANIVKGLSTTLKAQNGHNGVIVHNVIQQVKVRKYEVDIIKLQSILKEHKIFTNKEIASKLNQPLTLVEHWFRTDKSFSIPKPEIWIELKTLLKIKTNEFDKSIMEFEIKDNIFEKSNRIYDEKGISPTLTSSQQEKVIVKGNYSPSGHNASRIVDEKGIAPTVMENHGTVTAVIGSTQKNAYKGSIDGVSPSLTNAMGSGGGHIPMLKNNLRIRKLTPKECYRLMGFTNQDYSKAASVISNTQLYKTAGNSIVVDVLYYLFKEIIKHG